MSSAQLIYGCGANSYYATKLEMHDPYLWFKTDAGKTYVLMSELEISRARKAGAADEVLSMTDMAKQLRDSGLPVNEATLIIKSLKAVGSITELSVPNDFPTGLADTLRAEGYDVTPVKGSFFPQRVIKTEAEIGAIRDAQAFNEKAFYRAFEVLHQAEIQKDLTLKWQGELLTSERLQGMMNSVAAEYGAIGFNGGPIFAGGTQGADPHERGHGLLKANELIIIDSFPHNKNAYNGDLTRTVLKGDATDEQIALYESVKKSQQLGLDTIKAGVLASDVHNAVDASMKADGYQTGQTADGTPQGFFHSTGHALGLEVHDDGPGLSPRNTNPLEENMVVTVEPGLYYPHIGGVRIEDIVAVRKNRCENLTTLPKILNIADM